MLCKNRALGSSAFGIGVIAKSFEGSIFDLGVSPVPRQLGHLVRSLEAEDLKHPCPMQALHVRSGGDSTGIKSSLKQCARSDNSI
jgi:hypothetical protein